jgi:hypothetical protein
VPRVLVALRSEAPGKLRGRDEAEANLARSLTKPGAPEPNTCTVTSMQLHSCPRAPRNYYARHYYLPASGTYLVSSTKCRIHTPRRPFSVIAGRTTPSVRLPASTSPARINLAQL